MIKIKFEANSVAELRSLIADYLGASISPTKVEKPTKDKTTKTASEPTSVEEAPAPEEVITATNVVTLEDIRTLVLSGEIPKDKVKGLLGNFGVQRITEVPETDFATFYDQLSALKTT